MNIDLGQVLSDALYQKSVEDPGKEYAYRKASASGWNNQYFTEAVNLLGWLISTRRLDPYKAASDLAHSLAAQAIVMNPQVNNAYRTAFGDSLMQAIVTVSRQLDRDYSDFAAQTASSYQTSNSSGYQSSCYSTAKNTQASASVIDYGYGVTPERVVERVEEPARYQPAPEIKKPKPSIPELKGISDMDRDAHTLIFGQRLNLSALSDKAKLANTANKMERANLTEYINSKENTVEVMAVTAFDTSLIVANGVDEMVNLVRRKMSSPDFTGGAFRTTAELYRKFSSKTDHYDIYRKICQAVDFTDMAQILSSAIRTSGTDAAGIDRIAYCSYLDTIISDYLTKIFRLDLGLGGSAVVNGYIGDYLETHAMLDSKPELGGAFKSAERELARRLFIDVVTEEDHVPDEDGFYNNFIVTPISVVGVKSLYTVLVPQQPSVTGELEDQLDPHLANVRTITNNSFPELYSILGARERHQDLSDVTSGYEYVVTLDGIVLITGKYRRDKTLPIVIGKL